jgi:hypothetical protein
VNSSHEPIGEQAASATSATVGMGGAAIAAAVSACCAGPAFGPLIVAMFGASGAVALEGLRPYAVPLLALSGLAIVASFWLSARNAQRCPVQGPSAIARVIARTTLWVSAIVWLAAVAIMIWGTTTIARASTPAFTTLSASDEPFRAAFNRRSDAVRVVELVSPTCPLCLEGVSKIQHDLFANESSLHLAGFAIWVPMLNGTASNVPEAMTLDPDPRVANYWDGSNDLGTIYERLLPVSSGPAWDVYMIFAPGVLWNGTDPPKPSFWMHQLPIANAPHLDSAVFAQRAEALLHAH